MEQVLKHLQEDKERAKREEKELWNKLIKDEVFKEAMQSESFKSWFLKYMQYANIDPEGHVLSWRKTVEKVQTLNHMISEVEEKNTQWRIVEKLRNNKKS